MSIPAEGGSKLWASVCTRAVRNAAGQVDYYEGTVEEITERKQLEEQFRQAQKMEAIGRLAGGVAHDFNNLLTVVLGYSDMLLERLPEADPSRACIVEIRRSGERAAALTQRLLAFSREAGPAADAAQHQRSSPAWRRCSRLLGADITATELRAEPAPRQGRPGQLEQVLLNLAVNARDAMPEGGKLTLADVQHAP